MTFNYRIVRVKPEKIMAEKGPVPRTKVLYTEKQIDGAVKHLAARINKDYKDKCLLIIGVLKGSFVFIADLVRCLEIPVEIDFVQLSSYGSCTESSGKIKFLKRLTAPVKNRDVIVVEDIVDTGLTLKCLLDYLHRRKPASLKLCVLFDKVSRHKVNIGIDYLGYIVPDVFVVGYGIDFNEKFRELSELCYLTDEGKK